MTVTSQKPLGTNNHILSFVLVVTRRIQSAALERDESSRYVFVSHSSVGNMSMDGVIMWSQQPL